MAKPEPGRATISAPDREVKAAQALADQRGESLSALTRHAWNLMAEYDKAHRLDDELIIHDRAGKRRDRIIFVP